MKDHHIVIIGAGLGGLATPLRMAYRGHRVTVLEKNDRVGGRVVPITVGESRFDGGPTLLMMLDPFRKLFSDVGERFEDHVPIQLCDPSYRVFYADGNRIEATTNAVVMQERIRHLAGVRDAEAYPKFLQEVKDLYEQAVPNFVRTDYSSLADFAAPAQLRRVLRLGMLGNLAKRVEKWFSDEHLRMLFSFQTMYLGLSPYDAPWVYATLAHMEYGEGIFYPQGGLVSIVDAVAALAEKHGAVIRTGCAVEEADNSVRLKSGEIVTADAIVANADMPYAQRELMKSPTKRNLRYSCSAHLMYIEYEGELDGLEHHNVVFGSDFKGNLDSLFHNLDVPKDPAFYACVSKRSDPKAAPEGCVNLMLLIPVPNLDRTMTEAEQLSLESSVLDRLKREVGFDRDKIRAVGRRTPENWQTEFNLDRGAAFGISHDLFQSAFMRPGNRSKVNPNLFFVGASTTPGNGLPMVLISAELVEQRLLSSGVISG